MKETIKRNKLVVGNNSKSYNDKHPENPISLRPIHDAITNTPKILDKKNRLVPDTKKIRLIRYLSNSPRMVIAQQLRTM